MDLCRRPFNGVLGSYVEQYNERGKVVESRYFDLNDKPILNSENISVLRSTYDASGHETRREYFGVDGKTLVLSNEGYAGGIFEYDASGNITRRECFGVDGKTPILNNEGIAGWNSEYDAFGHETRREFFGIDGKTLVLSNEGIAGWNSEFDASGNEIKRTFFGTDNEPIELDPIEFDPNLDEN